MQKVRTIRAVCRRGLVALLFCAVQWLVAPAPVFACTQPPPAAVKIQPLPTLVAPDFTDAEFAQADQAELGAKKAGHGRREREFWLLFFYYLFYIFFFHWDDDYHHGC